MKLKTLVGKFIRINKYGVAKIWFIKNIYKKDYRVIIDYIQIQDVQNGIALFSGEHEMSYSEFQRDGITDKFTENKFDMNFSQTSFMHDFIRTLFNEKVSIKHLHI